MAIFTTEFDGDFFESCIALAKEKYFKLLAMVSL
jgi:hypothetical protein